MLYYIEKQRFTKGAAQAPEVVKRGLELEQLHNALYSLAHDDYLAHQEAGELDAYTEYTAYDDTGAAVESYSISTDYFREAKSYKNYPIQHIGSSDIASLILAGIDDGGLKLHALNFGEDGDYFAYVVDGNAEIGAHYELVAEFNTWLRIYDDEGLKQAYKADFVRVYRAGELGCIIQLVERR